MNKCCRCKQVKEDEEFTKCKSCKNGLSYYCKPCAKKARKRCKVNIPKRREKGRANQEKTKVRNRRYVWDYLQTHPCVVCGETDAIVLEFDHLGNKKDSISRMMNSGQSIKMIQQEIDKCQVLCSNCHKRKTAKEYNWYKTKL